MPEIGICFVYYVYNTLLITLQVLHIIWFYFIVLIAKEAIITGGQVGQWRCLFFFKPQTLAITNFTAADVEQLLILWPKKKKIQNWLLNKYWCWIQIYNLYLQIVKHHLDLCSSVWSLCKVKFVAKITWQMFFKNSLQDFRESWMLHYELTY